ncbi:hypothetical protein SNE35_26030 [Paucibacter sp. R3-3]|uniref:Uncharacterized protein n=1 Tax=Roseateles agri TaxID=3098619 RepID=A0ABU5DSF6_9BURK|nr:hypothetical protein [Paucibacter sp. R3-3]MDY0747987.1 hypothetical protein [Paucibacter sp. R3-3]
MSDLFLSYPLAPGTWLGFTDAKVGRPGEWVELENYQFLCGDEVTRLTLFNTLVCTSVASVLRFGLGLWLALLLNRKSRRRPSSAPSCCCPTFCRRPFRRLPSDGSTTRSSRSSVGRC